MRLSVLVADGNGDEVLLYFPSSPIGPIARIKMDGAMAVEVTRVLRETLEFLEKEQALPGDDLR